MRNRKSSQAEIFRVDWCTGPWLVLQRRCRLVGWARQGDRVPVHSLGAPLQSPITNLPHHNLPWLRRFQEGEASASLSYPSGVSMRAREC